MRQLINKIYAYKDKIEYTTRNSAVFDAKTNISSSFSTKNKCLIALQDVLKFTKSYAIVSDASENLATLLSRVASPKDLTWELLNKATDLCEDIKKYSLIRSVTRRHQCTPHNTFSGPNRFQEELPVLKHILWFPEVHFTIKNVDEFLDSKLYDHMDIKHVQLVLTEINRVQEYFFSGEWSWISIPRRFSKFISRLKDLFLQKEKLFFYLLSTKDPSSDSKKMIEQKNQASIIESVPLNVAILHKHAERDFTLGNYIRARNLCHQILTSFPTYEFISDVLKLMKQITPYIESITHPHAETQSTKDAPTPIKKIDPKKINPHTWRPYDDFS